MRNFYRYLFKNIIFVSLALFLTSSCTNKEEGIGKTKEVGNKERIKVVRRQDGAWQLLINGQPHFIKGVVFTPVKIGESPDQATLRDWTYYDDDNDGRNDVAYQTWLDRNKNNTKDPGEDEIGDFRLLKEMGVNTIRIYHVPSNNPILGDIYRKNPSTARQYDHPVNKDLLRKLYKDYGIRVIMGNFLGSWTVGSGASWTEGTDYTNPVHLENIKKSVRAMVLDNKDEPYVLMWLLGNENNIATWSQCNAQQEPAAYAKLIGELVDMIHGLDPDHPVAVSEGDNFNTLRLYPQYAPNIDILAYNTYRTLPNLNELFISVKKIFDRPILLGEIGQFAYNPKMGEDENLQYTYLKGSWRSVVYNSAAYYSKAEDFHGVGNSLGGVIFDWLDRWYMDGLPREHNAGHQQGDSQENLIHSEWYGIMTMGDGSDSLIRQKRKIYDYFREMWNQEN